MYRETTYKRFEMNEDSICWTWWNESGHSSRTSKGHWINDEDTSATLCGRKIPGVEDRNESAGIEVENGSYGNGFCKRCSKIEDRLSGEDCESKLHTPKTVIRYEKTGDNTFKFTF